MFSKLFSFQYARWARTPDGITTDHDLMIIGDSNGLSIEYIRDMVAEVLDGPGCLEQYARDQQIEYAFAGAVGYDIGMRNFRHWLTQAIRQRADLSRFAENEIADTAPTETWLEADGELGTEYIHYAHGYSLPFECEFRFWQRYTAYSPVA